ncbi:hypothetical protein [Clostridium beijerinckii]|uniref:hypothetical protein n=1 Tax=Clostridium beijerinckii TaxID=1520 RepID=UPI00156E870C|nr:hypothetical protein [Clostridium beijerinckii]NRT71468.1 hypothetical protein [Clostridium beijerinckii]
MNSKYGQIKKEIEELIRSGEELYDFIEKGNVKFNLNYQQWYSKSLEVIRQLVPNRLEDFKFFYRNEKGRHQSYPEKDINDFLSEEGIPHQFISVKVYQQINILKSAYERLDSVLYEIKNIVQADIFDSEIESARYLFKLGFLRAAGAICGVIIEKHFETVCSDHNLKISKKEPTISDYNDSLKKSEIIKTEMWRFVQRMGDLRNLCDHNKKEEPTKENVIDLIDGTDKIIKSIF